MFEQDAQPLGGDVARQGLDLAHVARGAKGVAAIRKVKARPIGIVRRLREAAPVMLRSSVVGWDGRRERTKIRSPPGQFQGIPVDPSERGYLMLESGRFQEFGAGRMRRSSSNPDGSTRTIFDRSWRVGCLVKFEPVAGRRRDMILEGGRACSR